MSGQPLAGGPFADLAATAVLGAVGPGGVPSLALLGEACALGAAIVWAAALVLFRTSGLSIAPIALNLFKNTIGLALLAATLLLTGESFAPPPNAGAHDVWILAISGVLGIALADSLFFAGLNRVGVGIISVVDCTYTPFVIGFSWLLIGEQLQLYHYAGMALILGGVLLATGHAPPAGATRRQLWAGVLFGVAAMASMALAIVMVKPVLERTPLFWATFVRLAAGHVSLLLIAMCLPSRRKSLSVFRPTVAWQTAIPGAVLGTYLSLLLWVAGFKFASASVAAVLNQTSVIFAILLATLTLGERLTRRKAAAAALAFGGVALVTAYPYLREALASDS